MSITKDLRKVFDACTVMAGVEPDFECVYMTKGVALLYLDEIDAENAQLKERIVTQKQTIQAYRDESREWREEAEHAQAENAKLREQSERLFDKALELATENSKLRELCKLCEREAENAKLRELVRDMWRFTGTACKKYPRLFDPAAQGGQTVQLNMIDAFEQRMRELGIEVDG